MSTDNFDYQVELLRQRMEITRLQAERSTNRTEIVRLQAENEALRSMKRCVVTGCGYYDGGELKRLQAENEALRKDAERVDFLGAVKGGVVICAPNTHGGTVDKWLVEYDDDPNRDGNFDECFGDSLRAAIDAAMQEQKP